MKHSAAGRPSAVSAGFRARDQPPVVVPMLSQPFPILRHWLPDEGRMFPVLDTPVNCVA